MIEEGRCVDPGQRCATSQNRVAAERTRSRRRSPWERDQGALDSRGNAAGDLCLTGPFRMRGLMETLEIQRLQDRPIVVA